jgi:MFS family permease
MPLMFQLTFGLDAFTSGLLVLAVFAGNLAMKPGTTWVLRRFGFRATLVANGLITAAGILACALLSPGTPVPIIVAVLFIGGLSRSMQFTALNTLGFADIPQPRMSGAHTLASMVQQMSMGMGIAIGAIALRLASLLEPAAAGASPSLQAFHIAFVLVGFVALAAIVDCLALAPDAGIEVSGHRRTTSSTG